MRLPRLGQSANKVGTMIILITVVLILYLLFLPPQNRDELLYGDSTPGNNITDSAVVERLVDVDVGDLEFVDRNHRKHSIPAYTVSSKLEGVELAQTSTMRVSRSLFNERRGTMQFQTTPSLTEDVRLSFNVEQSQGDLTVSLNGETLYTDNTGTGSIPPIRIDADRLRSSNTLEFKASSPGIAFWSDNTYSLDNVRVTANVKDTSKQRNYQTVYIPEKDFDQIERVEAEYIATCTEADVENFEVSINDFLLFQGTPDCALTTRKTFDPDALKPGQNELVTRIDQGRVLVDRFTLTTYFGETEKKTYKFEMSDEYFTTTDGDATLDDSYTVNTTFSFADDDEKQFNFFINGRRDSITTTDAEISRDISSHVFPGTNTIRLEPRNDFTMTTLQTDLRQRE